MPKASTASCRWRAPDPPKQDHSSDTSSEPNQGEPEGQPLSRQQQILARSKDTVQLWQTCYDLAEIRLISYIDGIGHPGYLESHNVDRFLTGVDFDQVSTGCTLGSQGHAAYTPVFLSLVSASTQVCYLYLWRFGNACGLKISEKQNVKLVCLQKIQEGGHAAYVADLNNRDVLVKNIYLANNNLPQMKYPLKLLPCLEHNFEHFVKFYAGNMLKPRWQPDKNNIMDVSKAQRMWVIDHIVDHLANIQHIIDQEFAMYHHHYHLNGLRKPWLCNMFYSLIQQVV